MPRYQFQPASVNAPVARPAQADVGTNDPTWRGVQDVGQSLVQLANLADQSAVRDAAFADKVQRGQDSIRLLEADSEYMQGIAEIESWYREEQPLYSDALAGAHERFQKLDQRILDKYGDDARTEFQASLIHKITARRNPAVKSIADESITRTKEHAKGLLSNFIQSKVDEVDRPGVSQEEYMAARAAVQAEVAESQQTWITDREGLDMIAGYDGKVRASFDKRMQEDIVRHQNEQAVYAKADAESVLRRIQDVETDPGNIERDAQGYAARWVHAAKIGDIPQAAAAEQIDRILNAASAKIAQIGNDAGVTSLDSIGESVRRYAGTNGVSFEDREKAFVQYQGELEKGVAAGAITRDQAGDALRDGRHDADQAWVAHHLLDEISAQEAVTTLSGPPIKDKPETLPSIFGKERAEWLAKAQAVLDGKRGAEMSKMRAEFLARQRNQVSILETQGVGAKVQDSTLLGEMEVAAEASGMFTPYELGTFKVEQAAAAKAFQVRTLSESAHSALFPAILADSTPGGLLAYTDQQQHFEASDRFQQAEMTLRNQDPGQVGQREVEKEGGPKLDTANPETWQAAVTASRAKQASLGITDPRALSKQQAGDIANSWIQSLPDQRQIAAVQWKALLGDQYPLVMGELAKEGLPPEAEWIPDVNENFGGILAMSAGKKYEDLRKTAVAMNPDGTKELEKNAGAYFESYRKSLPPELFDGTGQSARYFEMYKKVALNKFTGGGSWQDALQWAADRLFNDMYVFTGQGAHRELAIPKVYESRVPLIVDRGSAIIQNIELENVEMTQFGVPLSDQASRKLWKQQLVNEGYWVTTGDQKGAVLYHPSAGPITRRDGSNVYMSFDGQGWPKQRMKEPPVPEPSPTVSRAATLDRAYKAFTDARSAGDKAKAKQLYDEYKRLKNETP